MAQLADLPLQDMITGVLHHATVKLAAEGNPFARTETSGKTETTGKSDKTKSDKSEKTEKTASFTDPVYIEKLASAVEAMHGNFEQIITQVPGVLETAMSKLASRADSVGAGRGAGALQTFKSISGKQKYNKDKPEGEDPAASQAGAKPTTGGLPAGATQQPNNLGTAPGQSSGQVPTATYPEKGPLVNLGGQKKFASVREYYMWAVQKVAEDKGTEKTDDTTKTAPTPPTATTATTAGTEKTDAPHRPPFLPLSGKTTGKTEKTASDLAREAILRKLAGEDVMKAKISGGGHQGPLVGQGQLQVADATKKLPHQAGGPTGGFGNQGRTHIQSNEAAINATKKDTKGPQKSQLAQVLDEPALSAKHDTKINENLRNAGQAGVKIAADAAREFLQKIAEEGCTCDGKGECRHCKMTTAIRSTGSEKTAQMGMGGAGMGAPASAPPPPAPAGAGGMAPTAEAGAGADGCTCGNAGECKVCKLKAALAAAQQEGRTGGTTPEQGQPGTKDF